MSGSAVRDKLLMELVHQLYVTYPFYHDVLRPYLSSGTSIQGFELLPIMNKSKISANRCNLEIDAQGERIESFTSGTTGVPFRCTKTREEQFRLAMAISKHRRAWGLPSRHEMMLLTNRLSSEPKMLRHCANEMGRIQPHMIQGRFSGLHAFAEFIHEQRIPVPPTLRFLQNWGEPVSPVHREFVEQTFGVPLMDFYGIEEIWGIAFSNHQGQLVVDERLVYVEVIDPTNDSAMKEGDYGEILVTSFVMRNIPFVRYRTGDIGKIWRDPSTASLILELMPIRTSQIRLPGKTVQAGIFRYMDKVFHELSTQAGLRQYQVVQETYTQFRVLLASPSFDTTYFRRKLVALLTQFLGQEIDLAVEFVKEIEPHVESGKVQSFISRVP